LVPALSTIQDKPRFFALFSRIPSAIGLRQIFPRQTIKIFMGANLTQNALVVRNRGYLWIPAAPASQWYLRRFSISPFDSHLKQRIWNPKPFFTATTWTFYSKTGINFTELTP
jgi:hypothetical protein